MKKIAFLTVVFSMMTAFSFTQTNGVYDPIIIKDEAEEVEQIDESYSNRELFDQNREENVLRCADVFMKVGADSISARMICDCFIEKAYSVDSTFFLKDGAELDSFFINNIERLKTLCQDVLEEVRKQMDLP